MASATTSGPAVRQGSKNSEEHHWRMAPDSFIQQAVKATTELWQTLGHAFAKASMSLGTRRASARRLAHKHFSGRGRPPKTFLCAKQKGLLLRGRLQERTLHSQATHRVVPTTTCCALQPFRYLCPGW